MTDSIENYQSHDLEVIEVRIHEILVDASDVDVNFGEAVRFESGEVGRVVELSGARKVLVQVFDQKNIEVGSKVEYTGKPAGLEAPSEGVHRPGDIAFVPDGIPFDPPGPRLQEIDATRPPLDTGGQTRDTAAPLCRGGVNLIINASDESLLPELGESLPGTWTIGVGAAATIELEFDDPWQHLMSLRLAAAWAAHLRAEHEDIGVVARLPSPKSHAVHDPARATSTDTIAELVNELGEILVSTEEGRITSVFEVDISGSGLAAIAETMGFGEVDAQWFVDEEGRFDPRRSTSRANVDDATLRRRKELLARLELARKAQERAALFGEFELSDEERDAIEFARTLAD